MVVYIDIASDSKAEGDCDQLLWGFFQVTQLAYQVMQCAFQVTLSKLAYKANCITW